MLGALVQKHYEYQMECVNESYLIAHSTLTNQLNWNSIANDILFNENSFQNIVCILPTILYKTLYEYRDM